MDVQPARVRSASEAGLPSDLLRAAAAGDGRLVLVLGAGCSCDWPTSLPLADELSEGCHRQLINDGVLPDDAELDGTDLSAVARAVFDRTGGHRELIERFGPNRFRLAEPNSGYMVAAALFREGVTYAVMTLNFDLAATTALASVGADEVSVIRGPEDHHRLGARNLIYLHRNIESAPDDLILRTEQLENEWRDNWTEIVAQRVLGSPVVVFAGLGAPAAVLVETARRILTALGEEARVYVVDPSPYERSRFFAALDLSPDCYIRLGWNAFMDLIAARVVEEHRADVERSCREFARAHSFEPEDVSALCHAMATLGLLGFGRLRARWFFADSTYARYPRDADQTRLQLADLVSALAAIERLCGRRARVGEDGVVHFLASEGSSPAVLVASGGGWMQWTLLMGKLHRRLERLRKTGIYIDGALVCGASGERAQVVPDDIAGEGDSGGVAGSRDFKVLGTDDLRRDPSCASQLVG